MYNPRLSLSRPMVFILVAMAIILVLALGLAAAHQTGMHTGTLMWFDEDLSDSVIGWAIAIPVLILTFAAVAVVLTGTGVIVASALALALAAVMLCVLFAVLLALLPFAAFLAVPILLVVGLVKLFSNRGQSKAA